MSKLCVFLLLQAIVLALLSDIHCCEGILLQAGVDPEQARCHDYCRNKYGYILDYKGYISIAQGVLRTEKDGSKQKCNCEMAPDFRDYMQRRRMRGVASYEWLFDNAPRLMRLTLRTAGHLCLTVKSNFADR